MNRILKGLFAGTLATIPMSIVMQVLHRWPAREPEALPPEQITNVIAGEITAQVGRGEQLDEPQMQMLTIASHFGFGASMGAVYALFAPKIPAHPMIRGAVWGMLVWSLSYLGWLPAAQILPPATRQPKRRNVLMIAAHLVWGVGVAFGMERLAPNESV